MSDELDLSFLKPEEIIHLRSVLKRSKELEELHREKKKNNEKEITSDDVIRSRWQEAHGSMSSSYVPAQDAVIAALKLDEVNEQPGLPNKTLHLQTTSHYFHAILHPDEVSETVVEEFTSYPRSYDYRSTSDSSSLDSIELERIKPTFQAFNDGGSESTLLQLAAAAKPDSPSIKISPAKTGNDRYVKQISLNQGSTVRNSMDLSKQNSNYTPIKDNTIRERKLTNTSRGRREENENNKIRERISSVRSASESPPTTLLRDDVPSMVSRPSVYADEFVGEVELTLTYFPPESVKQKTFPSKGTFVLFYGTCYDQEYYENIIINETRTYLQKLIKDFSSKTFSLHDDLFRRFPENKQLDVLTRKTYVILTGSKVPVEKSTKSGARRDKDGELHLLVRRANDLILPSAVMSKAKTYVKCYLLPDRYHGSKMRSEVVKNAFSPRYDHRFVFRGFCKSEFYDRSVELIVGGITTTHGRHVVVGGIRLSDGKQIGKYAAVKDSNEEEINFWKSALENPGTEVNAIIPLQAKIKLTYK